MRAKCPLLPQHLPRREVVGVEGRPLDMPVESGDRLFEKLLKLRRVDFLLREDAEFNLLPWPAKVLHLGAGGRCCKPAGRAFR